MRTLRHFKNNFTSGELSPLLQGRADLTPYVNGSFTMENVLSRPQGGFRRRPGVVHVARAKYTDRPCRLARFKFNVTQAYLLEIGDEYMRFYSNRGRLEETAQAIEGIADNGSGLIRVTLTGHGYVTGDHVAIRNVGGAVEANTDWTVTRLSNDVFDLQGSAFGTTYTSGGTASKIIEIATPWTDVDLADVRYSQDADLVYFTHPNYWPHLLTRVTATSFTLTQIDNVVSGSEPRWIGGPFSPDNPTLTHTMTWGSATLTAGTSSTMTSSTAYFTDDMIGMYFKYRGTVSDVQGTLRITAVGSATPTTTATMVIETDIDGNTATHDWALGAWGEYSGYPAVVTFFEQRLLFGNTATDPQTVWASAVGAYYTHTLGTANDEAWSITVAADNVDAVQWLAAHDSLLLGTTSSEYLVTGGQDSAVTPTNAVVRQQSSWGSAPMKAVKVGNSILYVQRAGRRIRDMNFSLEADRYLTDDLTLLASHIFDDDPVIDGDFQLGPDPTVWFVSEGGVLASLLLIKSQQVLSWARHPVANTEVESVCVIPATASDVDDVWVSGAVTVNGQTTRYIGYMDNAMYADWGLFGTFGSPVTTISGLDHLTGESVVLNGNGAVYPNKTVTAGSVTLGALEAGVTSVMVGLPFTPQVVPVSPEFQLPDGPSFGVPKRYAKILIFTQDTMTMAVNGEKYEPRDPDDDMDAAPPIAGTRIFQYTSLGAAEIPTLSLTQPLPLGWDVTSLYGEVEVG